MTSVTSVLTSLPKAPTNYNTDRHIDHIATKCKLFELFKHDCFPPVFFHKKHIIFIHTLIIVYT